MPISPVSLLSNYLHMYEQRIGAERLEVGRTFNDYHVCLNADQKLFVECSIKRDNLQSVSVR